MEIHRDHTKLRQTPNEEATNESQQLQKLQVLRDSGTIHRTVL